MARDPELQRFAAATPLRLVGGQSETAHIQTTACTPCQHLTLVLHFVCESRESRAGARRGGVSVSRRSRTPPNRHSCAAGSPTPCASRHTDTAVLPPFRCLRYRLPMEVAISHRNQNSTSPHAVGAASLILGGLVRIDGRRGLNGGCFPSAKYGCFFPAQQNRNETYQIARSRGMQRGGSGGGRGTPRPAPHGGVVARPSASDDRQDWTSMHREWPYCKLIS